MNLDDNVVCPSICSFVTPIFVANALFCVCGHLSPTLLSFLVVGSYYKCLLQSTTADCKVIRFKFQG